MTDKEFTDAYKDILNEQKCSAETQEAILHKLDYALKDKRARCHGGCWRYEDVLCFLIHSCDSRVNKEEAEVIHGIHNYMYGRSNHGGYFLRGYIDEFKKYENK